MTYEDMVSKLLVLKGDKPYRQFAVDVGLRPATLFNILAKKHKPSYEHSRIIKHYLDSACQNVLDDEAEQLYKSAVKISRLCHSTDKCCNCPFYTENLHDTLCRLQKTSPECWAL